MENSSEEGSAAPAFAKAKVITYYCARMNHVPSKCEHSSYNGFVCYEVDC